MDVEEGAKKVTARVSNASEASLGFLRCPDTFIVQCGTGDIDDGAYCVIRVLLRKGGAKAIGARIAV